MFPFELRLALSSGGGLSYLASLLTGSSGDIETVNPGEGGGAVDVVGGDLDVVEGVIVGGDEGVPAVVGEGGGGGSESVAHHHSLLPHPASRLSLELKVDNLSRQVCSLVFQPANTLGRRCKEILNQNTTRYRTLSWGIIK